MSIKMVCIDVGIKFTNVREPKYHKAHSKANMQQSKIRLAAHNSKLKV